MSCRPQVIELARLSNVLVGSVCYLTNHSQHRCSLDETPAIMLLYYEILLMVQNIKKNRN